MSPPAGYPQLGRAPHRFQARAAEIDKAAAKKGFRW